jgi:hypothetical protein
MYYRFTVRREGFPHVKYGLLTISNLLRCLANILFSVVLAFKKLELRRNRQPNRNGISSLVHHGIPFRYEIGNEGDVIHAAPIDDGLITWGE